MSENPPGWKPGLTYMKIRQGIADIDIKIPEDYVLAIHKADLIKCIEKQGQAYVRVLPKADAHRYVEYVIVEIRDNK